MKRFRYFPLLLLFAFLLTGCGESGKKEDNTPDTATFRVDIHQSGDYKKFVKIITVGGGDFKYTDQEDKAMPTVLFDDTLTEPNLSFEAENVRELNINSTIEFSSVEQGPATMDVLFVIFKNGKEIDQQTFTYRHDSTEETAFLNYKAK